jgi:hypothetical protein
MPHFTGIPKVPKIEPVDIQVKLREGIEGAKEAERPPVTEAEPAEIPKSPEQIDTEARGLGIVGDGQSSVFDGTPEEGARRSMAADRPQDKLVGEPPESDPWYDRWQQTVNKLETPAQMKDFIYDAARRNAGFTAARQGEIPLHHVEAIADAAGLDASEINRRGLGRTLRNDDEVRVALQVMRQLVDDVEKSAAELDANPSEANDLKFQEAVLRHDMGVEQVVGHRAEWGRTGNVFQEFMSTVKDAETLNNFLKERPGNGPRSREDLRKLAQGVRGLPKTAQAKLLNKARQPDFWDKYMWYWTNALISGPITHTKYILANTVYGLAEIGTTAVAAGVGEIRRQIQGGEEGVHLAEAKHQLYGYFAGMPGAFKAAVQAARTGLQTPLPGQLALGELPKINSNLFFQQIPAGLNVEVMGRKIPIGTLIGLPSRGASAIHSFFNSLGYRASIEEQAARQAYADGGADFAGRQHQLTQTPTEAMMRQAINDGYRLTFIDDLGPKAKGIARLVRSAEFNLPLGGPRVNLGQIVMPFTHIPFNLLKRATEYNPALGLLRQDVRDDIAGTNGAVAQDKAIARMVVGSAAGAGVMALFANDLITGFGPIDPKEKNAWIATGHQQYSVKIGGTWYSFNRFGPIGTDLGLLANFAEIVPHLQNDQEELTKAASLLAHHVGRLLQDEVGMQSFQGILDTINDPEHKGARFISSLAGSMLPYSSALRQAASAMDPSQRQVKSVLDGLRYYIPGWRETLLPKRDYAGREIPNAGFGLGGALGPVIQHRAASTDPVDFEMATLGLRPGMPMNMVGGQPLPPQLYDRYAAMAGAMTHTALEAFVSQPGWFDLPVGIRHDILSKAITKAHKDAGEMLKASRFDLVQNMIENRSRKIQGQKPLPLPDDLRPVPTTPLPPPPPHEGSNVPMGIRG